MDILSIIFFLATNFCLGYSLLRLTSESENFLERNLMRIGVGIAAFIVLGYILNLMSVPIDWRIFLIISLITPLLALIKNIGHWNLPKGNIRIGKYDLSIAVMLLIFALTLYMYAKGAFEYPYLEDDDPWSHAISAKYVSEMKTLFRPENAGIKYIDPYPPAYTLIMGVVHQTNDSIYWTLKFFNALIISLSIIFFYFFANKLIGDWNKALFSTFALASVPAFMSHFIWSISLVVPLYFVSFYSLEKVKDDKRWMIAASIAISATLAITPSHSAYFGLLLIVYYASNFLMEKKVMMNIALSGLLGLIGSFIIWWLPAIKRWGLIGTLREIGVSSSISVASIAGTGDRIYLIKDFAIAQKTNLINNPIGIGIAASLISVVALLSLYFKYREGFRERKLAIFAVSGIIAAAVILFLSSTYTKYVEKRGVKPLEKGTVPFPEFFSDNLFIIAGLACFIFLYTMIIIISYNHEVKDKSAVLALGWLILTFYAVNASPFFYKLSPFRAWLVFAVPLAILMSEGMWFLMNLMKDVRYGKHIILALAVAGIILTSSAQKYSVNTSQWPPGGFWSSYEEIEGYLWMKNNIAPNAGVFTFINQGAVIGNDKYVCRWCQEERDFSGIGMKMSAKDISSWLRKRNYEYFVVDAGTAKRFGANETEIKLKEMASSGLFQPMHQNEGFILFRVLGGTYN